MQEFEELLGKIDQGLRALPATAQVRSVNTAFAEVVSIAEERLTSSATSPVSGPWSMVCTVHGRQGYSVPADCHDTQSQQKKIKRAFHPSR